MTQNQTKKQGKPDLLLEFEGLSIGFGSGEAGTTVVKDFSATLRPGEILALVGESGSGKTMVSRAILDLLPPGGKITKGRICFQGQDLSTFSKAEMQKVRGADIGMVFQEPMTSLNPTLTVGFQMAEALKWHFNLSDKECRKRSIEMLKQVDIANPKNCLGKYPHEFSGGMCQRILLASVLMMKPALLIADEPTTALDVLAQKQVMDILCDIVSDLKIAVLLITHDLGLVAQYADHVVVMQQGRLVEKGSVQETLLSPTHPYTQGLVGALPQRVNHAKINDDRPLLCEAINVDVSYKGRAKWPWQASPVHHVLEDLSLSLYKGETYVIVGQSGSGKTTIGRAMLGLIRPDEGIINYNSIDINSLSNQELLNLRQNMQMVFQDPYSALDPRMKLGEIIMEGLRHNKDLDKKARYLATVEMLSEVGFDESYFQRLPHELSGGQRQRINIARALVSKPEFVVADEPVSALDITVQKEILALFGKLQKKYGFACLFITHDLSVAEQIADRIAVLYHGKIVEEGSRDQIFDTPCHPYSRNLLDAAPRLVQGDEGYRLSSHERGNFTLPEPYIFEGWEDANNGPPHSQKAVFIEIEQGHKVACYQK